MDGSFNCYTLENAAKAVPPGTYEIELYDSPKHGKDTPQLKDVPGRFNLQIHIANYPHELEGCIAVGLDYGNDTVIYSKNAFTALKALIVSVISRGEPVTLTIL